jgi:hypothetical protein
MDSCGEYEMRYAPLPLAECQSNPEAISREEEEEEELEKTSNEHLRNRRGLWVRVSIGAVTTLSIFCLLYAISSLIESSNTRTRTSREMKLQIIIPSFAGFPLQLPFLPTNKKQGPHFPVLLDMLHSMACLITDIEDINIAVILSSTAEVTDLETLLSDPSRTQNCTESYLNYNTKKSAHLRHPPILTLHNLYDIFPASIQNLTHANDTSNLVPTYGKYKYQAVKKLAAAAYFDFDYAILLDSEGFVIRPVEFKEMVRQWAKAPVVWKELAMPGSPRRNDWVAAINEACAHMLSRTMENFGTSVSFWEG